MGQKICRSPQFPLCGVALCAALEAFLAFGAGDGDFALVPGDADGLAAAGTDEIAVLAVPDPVNHQHEPSVFLIAAIDVAGKTAEDRPDHQCVAQHPEDPAENRAAQEGRQQARRQTHAENDHIQAVCTVAPRHEMPDARTDALGNAAHPIADIVHTITCKPKKS